MNQMNINITRRQHRFIKSQAFETLYGGAAGGGKSYGQLIDAELFAFRYPGSKQIIFRRTFGELDKSIIRTALEIYPRALCSYNDSKHMYTFQNGSIIDFAYCDNEKDVYRYQSAEYDVIRFDELTHFNESQYVYLISRCRGANNYPKCIKSSTNPGGVGHSWVKKRFIDIGAPDTIITTDTGTRMFIPAFVQDNKFLVEADPGYVTRLENLSEKDKQALLYGDWDIFDGQYFNEFSRRLHVVSGMELPDHWRRYVCIDYGLDMCAAYWIAMDEQEHAYVYRELHEPGLIVTEAARKIKGMSSEPVEAYIAPPDLWNRHSDTGKSTAELFAECGVYLVKAKNDRVQGWYNLKEWIKPYKNEYGQMDSRLKIFNNCIHLIEYLPAIQHSQKNPNDCANDPHEVTHAPDALRYFASFRPVQTDPPPKPRDFDEPAYELEDFINYGK